MIGAKLSGLTQLSKAILSRKHPDYDDFVDQWAMYEDTYRGGRKWFKKHIHKYHKEGDEEFATRVDRAYRFNHPKEIVDLVNKYIYRATISRSESVPEEIKAFWKSSSKRGWPIEEMMPVLNKWSSVFGRIWVVVDATKLNVDKDATKLTSRDVKGMGYRVWSYWVRPQDVLDLEYDESDGQLSWVLIKESYRVNGEDPLKPNGGMRTRYRLWTRTKSTLYQHKINEKGEELQNIEEVDSNIHNLGVVPVIPLDNITSNEDYTSSSLIADIAYLDKAVANYLSNLDAIIQDQTFSQLAMPAQALMFGESEDSKKTRESYVEMGKKRVFLYDGESKQPPFYLSPDPKQAELIITAIRQIINEIYHSVGVAGERTKQDNSQGIDNSSGVAKAYDFERVNSLLSSKGATLQRFENTLCEMILRYHGVYKGRNEEDWVKYPDNYDVRGFADELNISERLELISTPLKLRQHQLKRAVEKLYPSMAEDKREELFKAIDDMEDTLDLLGKAGVDDSVASNALPNEQNQDSGNDGKDD